MKSFLKFLACLFVPLILAGLALGADAPADAPAAPASIGSVVWAFLNSSLGLTVVGGAIAWLLARLFTWKPAWKVYHDQYKGLMIEAVKQAEKAIPNGTPNKAAARADAALKYILKVEASLATADPNDLRQALNLVHAQAETNENI